MSKKDIALSDSQFQLMSVLWTLEQASVTDILESWPSAKKPAYTTIGTVLSRLEKRGLLISERRGREKVYRALVQESEVRRSMVSNMVGTLFAGNPQALLTHLIKETDVTPEDLKAAQDLLNKETKK
ncbi:MAG: BlaI/MecI/CopY family transcriptional regulator [Pseudomonadota bacterium]